MEKLLLGIDVGTTSAKAALFGLDGRLEAVGNAGYPIHYVRPTWVEQQPEDWWQAVCLAIRQAWAAVPNGPERIIGVAVSSQAPTLIALDDTGQPLRPALIWMDRRAEAEAVDLAKILGEDEVHRISGNRPDAFYLAAKLRWFKNHEPELMAQTYRFVQIPGYINYRLTQMYSLDHVHAALLQLRDYATGEWSEVLCNACGVDPAQFPEIQPGHHMLGSVRAEAAEATGLLPGTPVMVGTVDGSAAALEAGATTAGIGAEMTGTSTVVLMPSDCPMTHPLLIAMPHAIPDRYLLLGATVASGANLRWYRDQFGQLEMQTASQMNLDPFDLLTQQAARVRPGSDGIIFLPYMMGERSPLWNTNARGVFFGLSLSSTGSAVIRAILEGSAFALRHNVEVAEQAGVRLNEIRSVGGGARSALWCQIKADVLGLPVVLPEAPVGAPFGDAMLVGLGLGLYPDVLQSVQQLVKLKQRFEPDRENHQRYQQIYPIFRSIYEHLREDFDHAAALFVSDGNSS